LEDAPLERGPSIATELYGLAPRSYLLFACGRLDSTKGLHHLIDAYRSGNFEHRLLVIGDFTHDPEYSRVIERMCKGDPNIVLHRSLLDRAALLKVVRECRVFVFPSEVEAMSMMLLEAVSCRALVVCSDIPENAEVVGEDYPYLFSLSVPGDLAARMRRALEDPVAADVMEHLFQRARERFDWGVIARQYSELYSRLAPLNP
jgi:glycosyltransferase involved in cell wall biosynthesis